MDGDAELAARYLKRAAEIKMIAEKSEIESDRTLLLSVATDYEQMARALSEMARAGKPRVRE